MFVGYFDSEALCQCLDLQLCSILKPYILCNPKVVCVARYKKVKQIAFCGKKNKLFLKQVGTALKKTHAQKKPALKFNYCQAALS